MNGRPPPGPALASFGPVLIASLTGSVTDAVATRGIYAIFLLMLVDAVFPAASELVMLYGGALASGGLSGRRVELFGQPLSSHLGAYLAVAVAGTIGYLVGSWLGWGIGARAGRPFVERHAHLFHLSPAKLQRADAWFQDHGQRAVLLGRLTPVVRSFVSIPAGVQRMAIAPYTVSSAIGSAVWCFGIAGAGWALGASYERFHRAFDVISIAVVGVLVIAGWWLLRRRGRRR
jgi:membrane protein DedA with SNARE-associated domain